MPAKPATPPAKTLSAPQKALIKLGLVRDIDLALHLPLRYEDETRIVKLRDVREGDTAQIEATVTACEITMRPRRQLLVTVEDGSDTCVMRFFSFYPSHLKTLAVGARTALATSLGVTSASGLTAPAPNDPVVGPRIYGMVGLEMSVYLDCLRSGRTPRVYDVTSSYGVQPDERWTWTPGSTLDAGAWSVAVQDADNLSTIASASASLDVVSATAAAGASKRFLCLGDSTTAAAVYTARLLALATANSSAVQPTLLGTLGSGSNKHEGRGGWTLANYFSAAAPGGVTNPFYNSGTSRFDMAYYLSNTGQSAPHAVLIHLGINDVFSATSDAAVNSIMDTYIDQLSRIIGLTADAAVGSILEASASTVTVPI